MEEANRSTSCDDNHSHHDGSTPETHRLGTFRSNSTNSADVTLPEAEIRQSNTSRRREIYLDEEGNLVYGDETTNSDREDETQVVEVHLSVPASVNEPSNERCGEEQRESPLASLSQHQSHRSLVDDSSISFSVDGLRSEEFQAQNRSHRSSLGFSANDLKSDEFRVSNAATGRRARRVKSKSLSLGERLARLPGAPTGRYLDQSADYTSVVGNDAATFVIARREAEPPPRRSSLASAGHSSLNSGSRLAASTSHLEAMDPSGDANTESIDKPTMFPDPPEPHTSEEQSLAAPPALPAPQFQAVVLSFLAGVGGVSVAHAARVIGESINLVPEGADIFVFDYDGHVVERLPDGLVERLGFARVESDTTRFHLNETKKIMWRLGHSTESQGRRIQAWLGKAKRQKLLLSIV